MAASSFGIRLIDAASKLICQWTNQVSMTIGELKQAAAKQTGIAKDQINLYIRSDTHPEIRELRDEAQTLAGELLAFQPALAQKPAVGTKVRCKKALKEEPETWRLAEPQDKPSKDVVIIPAGEVGEVVEVADDKKVGVVFIGTSKTTFEFAEVDGWSQLLVEEPVETSSRFTVEVRTAQSRALAGDIVTQVTNILQREAEIALATKDTELAAKDLEIQQLKAENKQLKRRLEDIQERSIEFAPKRKVLAEVTQDYAKQLSSLLEFVNSSIATDESPSQV